MHCENKAQIKLLLNIKKLRIMATNVVEIWKDVKGFEGLYQVSSFGQVKSLNYRLTETEYITPSR